MSPAEEAFLEALERESLLEVNTKNHQRVNAQAMKRAYSGEDVKVSPTKLEYLAELLAAGVISPDAVVPRLKFGVDGCFRSLACLRDHGHRGDCLFPFPPRMRVTAVDQATGSITYDWADLPASKCPPTCTPAAPCRRPLCEALLYLDHEASLARDQLRDDHRDVTPKKPPRPEARRIGAADLSFGRWNGRVPR